MGFDTYHCFALLISFLLLPLSSCAGPTPSQGTPTARPGPGEGEQNEEARLYINITVSAEVAADLLRTQPQSQAAREILEIVSEYGLEIEPLHPGVEDPLMSRNFFIAVPDQGTAEQIVARLQALPAFDSAYFTPPGEPPGASPGDSPGGAPF
jgi:hypothetical protein